MTYDPIEIQRIAPRVDVLCAPQQALISLDLLVPSDEDVLRVSGRNVSIGSIPRAVEYEVVGLSEDCKYLVLEKLYDGRFTDD